MNQRELPPVDERIEIVGGDGLAIRQLIPDDAQAYFDALHHDPSRFQHGEEKTLQKYPTVDKVRASIYDAAPDKLRFGVWDANLLVSSVNLKFNRPRSAELGYWSGYGGHHYSQRAAELLIPYAFENFDIDRITAWVVVQNEGSRKVLKKLGFTQLTNGADQVMYELARETI